MAANPGNPGPDTVPPSADGDTQPDALVEIPEFTGSQFPPLRAVRGSGGVLRFENSEIQPAWRMPREAPRASRVARPPADAEPMTATPDAATAAAPVEPPPAPAVPAKRPRRKSTSAAAPSATTAAPTRAAHPAAQPAAPAPKPRTRRKPSAKAGEPVASPAAAEPATDAVPTQAPVSPPTPSPSSAPAPRVVAEAQAPSAAQGLPSSAAMAPAPTPTPTPSVPPTPPAAVVPRPVATASAPVPPVAAPTPTPAVAVTAPTSAAPSQRQARAAEAAVSDEAMLSHAPVLAIEGLAKFYGSVPVFESVSLAIRPGEFVAILGESGIGKSTLLNCMAGLDQWDKGSVMLAGHDLGQMDDTARALLRRQAVGFVFQAFHVLPHLDVAQNVALPLMLLRDALDISAPTDAPADAAPPGLGMPQRPPNWFANVARALRHWRMPARAPGWSQDPRVLDMLDAVGLGGMAKRLPHQLSGGQLQRVALARALVHKPLLVLADEPTGNLDPDTAERVMEVLSNLTREQGTSVVLVTHSQAAAAHADRVCTLRADGIHRRPPVYRRPKAMPDDE